jgi:D-amino-acid oxidase
MHQRAFLERRGFLAGLVVGGMAPSTLLAQTVAGRGPVLPSPIFPTNPDTASFETRAGLRPYRAGGYRLETETIGSKYVVHNYGHGGAGITMSWGCAAEVARLVSLNRANMAALDVAVLGAGVMGMTAAALLLEQGYRVTLYSDKFTPDTTSDVAGGQWAPSVVGVPDAARHHALLVAAYAKHRSFGRRYGVSDRDNYTHFRSSDLDEAIAASGAQRESLNLLPFQRIYSGGYKYPTLLVEPPIFLRTLYSDLRARGANIVRRRFSSPDEVQQLTEPVVVNCMALGSRGVWADTNLRGRKGVLALLRPQPNLHYLYSGIGYLFPRQDHLVIGGSLEVEGSLDAALSDMDKARLLVKVVRAVFQGAIPVPDWLSGNERILGANMIRSTEQYAGTPSPDQ